MPTNDSTHALFRSEYDLELEAWLRRRFHQVCICYLILGVTITVIRALVIGASNTGAGRVPALIITGSAAAISIGAAAYFLFSRRWIDSNRAQLLNAASILILMLGGISLIKALIIQQFRPEPEMFLLPLFFWHLIACFFLPWTPRESLRPILPLLVLWMLGVLFLESGDLAPRISKVIFGPLILAPGLAIAALRLKHHGEDFRTRMFSQMFTTMRQELSQARSIHESMFPAPYDDGHVRFEYTYTPMRDLGGDYVHLHIGAEGVSHLVLLDVTGHGLAAALTVNRLYGELERIRAESPRAEPGEVLSLLNRYIHLTMVRHNIFVTALAIMLDPYEGKLHWANAGHPPAFLRGANGNVAQLTATSVLLGALEAREFDPDPKSIELSPGDALVIYTDGVYEARDRSSRMLGLNALRGLMTSQPAPANWPQFIAASVQKHSGGRADDDILVAAVTFLKPRSQPAAARRTMVAS